MELSKNRKEQENKVHEVLYKNITLLNYFYPPSRDLKAVLKPNMFVKNNKAAFFEASYYLLDIYDPAVTKEKLKSWPPFDLQREQQFRNEFLSYVSEINNSCDYANINMPMASHLIAPGGFRFARFMLKLSEVAVHKHLLQTRGIDVLNCPKATKNENVNKAVIRNFKMQTNIINDRTKDILDNFEKTVENNREKAQQIYQDITKFDRLICDAKKEYENAEKEFNANHPSYPSFESLEEKLSVLKIKSNDISHLNTVFSDCENLMNHLNGSEFLLEHRKDDFKNCTDPELQALSHRNELDLIEFFKCLNNFLERAALTLGAPTTASIEKFMDQIDDLTEKYEQLSKEYEQSVTNFSNLVEETQKMFESVIHHQLNAVEDLSVK